MLGNSSSLFDLVILQISVIILFTFRQNILLPVSDNTAASVCAVCCHCASQQYSARGASPEVLVVLNSLLCHCCVFCSKLVPIRY